MISMKPAEDYLWKQPRWWLIARAVIFAVLFLVLSGLGGFLFSRNVYAGVNCLLLSNVFLLYYQINNKVMNMNGIGRQVKFGPIVVKIHFVLAVIYGLVLFSSCIAYGVLGHLKNQDIRDHQSCYIAIVPGAIGAIIAPFLAYETFLVMKAPVPPAPFTAKASFPV